MRAKPTVPSTANAAPNGSAMNTWDPQTAITSVMNAPPVSAASARFTGPLWSVPWRGSNGRAPAGVATAEAEEPIEGRCVVGHRHGGPEQAGHPFGAGHDFHELQARAQARRIDLVRLAGGA